MALLNDVTSRSDTLRSVEDVTRGAQGRGGGGIGAVGLVGVQGDVAPGDNRIRRCAGAVVQRLAAARRDDGSRGVAGQFCTVVTPAFVAPPSPTRMLLPEVLLRITPYQRC